MDILYRCVRPAGPDIVALPARGPGGCGSTRLFRASLFATSGGASPNTAGALAQPPAARHNGYLQATRVEWSTYVEGGVGLDKHQYLSGVALPNLLLRP